MVFLPSRASPQNDESDAPGDSFSPGSRAIIDLLDVVGNVRDGAHLQCVAFVAQEFGLLAQSVFLFGTTATEPRRPHSLLLEGHFCALWRDGVVDLDGAGRLRLRRDLFAVPPSRRASRRLSALGMLSPHETVIFAAAVLRLAGEGRYAGSARHDEAFHGAVTHLAAGDEEQPCDVAAICDARQRLLTTKPVLLTPV